MRMKKMKIIAAMVFMALIFLAGCSKQPSQNTASGEAQLARLSWGKLNYEPEIIKVKANQPVRITADTERLTGCFRSFVIPELGVSHSITEANNVIEFTPTKKGTFTFGCSMGMGQGNLVVE